MAKILIKNVELDGKITDVLIENKRFKKIAPVIDDVSNAQIIDGKDKAILPPFYNTHTHAAMTLLRSYADDKELFDWLQNYIWPLEAKLTPQDIYIGSRLAFLEMIKSGTVFSCDMYWHQLETAKAADEMGIRVAVGEMFLQSTPELNEMNRKNNIELEKIRGKSELVEVMLDPHAIYTVPKDILKTVAEKMKKEDFRLTIHASETQLEVENCFTEHHISPIAYLESLGLLTEKTVLAHCVHLFDDDIKVIRDTGAVIAHNPVSNMKLNSGRFRFQDCLEAGCKITLGTDGACSNNNLSMLDEMKFAALSAKSQFSSPTAGKDIDIFKIATLNGALAFDIDAGEIKEGKLADAMLVDLNNHFMVADYKLISNMVYSADSSVIDTVICNGEVLMLNRKVRDEDEIIREARKCCASLRNR